MNRLFFLIFAILSTQLAAQIPGERPGPNAGGLRGDDLKAAVDLELARAMSEIRSRLHAAIDRAVAPCPRCGMKASARMRPDPRDAELKRLRKKVAELERRLGAVAGPAATKASPPRPGTPKALIPVSSGPRRASETPRWATAVGLELEALPAMQRSDWGLPRGQGWRIRALSGLSRKEKLLKVGTVILAGSGRFRPDGGGVVALELASPKVPAERTRLIIPVEPSAAKPAPLDGDPVKRMMREQIQRLMQGKGAVIIPPAKVSPRPKPGKTPSKGRAGQK